MASSCLAPASHPSRPFRPTPTARPPPARTRPLRLHSPSSIGKANLTAIRGEGKPRHHDGPHPEGIRGTPDEFFYIVEMLWVMLSTTPPPRVAAAEVRHYRHPWTFFVLSIAIPWTLWGPRRRDLADPAAGHRPPAAHHHARPGRALRPRTGSTRADSARSTTARGRTGTPVHAAWRDPRRRAGLRATAAGATSGSLSSSTRAPMSATGSCTRIRTPR